MKKTYGEKLKDPRWQRKRLEFLEREHFMCEKCFSETETLHVHHGYYEAKKEPWEYDTETLHCVCEKCHKEADALRVDMQRSVAGFSLEHQKTVRDIAVVFGHMSDHQVEAVFEYARSLGCVTVFGDTRDFLDCLAENIAGLNQEQAEVVRQKEVARRADDCRWTRAVALCEQ